MVLRSFIFRYNKKYGNQQRKDLQGNSEKKYSARVQTPIS